jgi:hypothetical protein
LFNPFLIGGITDTGTAFLHIQKALFPPLADKEPFVTKYFISIILFLKTDNFHGFILQYLFKG